jgi:transcriptional regulator with XRE-family HTH domain
MLGERLRGARLMAGFSQEELAERAGVTKMAISKYERDIMQPSSRVLMKLGKALGCKVEYFLRPIQVKVEGAIHREKAGRAQRNRKAVYARVAECVERYLTIESILNQQNSFKMPQIKRGNHSSEDVERVAVELREAWELGLGPIVSLVDVLEDNGIKVCLIPGDVGFDALLILMEDKSPVIAVKDGVPGDRLRFNLAHELGHLILGHTPNLTKEDEKAAHRFAGAFLVPEQTARRELAAWGPKRPLGFLVMLKQEYGLSVQAWIYRAKEVGVVSQAEHTRLWQKVGPRRKHEFEPPYPPERPMRMKRLVNVALMNDLISEARAAEVLAVPVTEIRKQLEQINVASVGAVCS